MTDIHRDRPTIVNTNKLGKTPGRYIAIPQDLFETLVSEVDALFQAENLAQQSTAVIELSNSLSDAKSWHQDYDVNRDSFYPVEGE
jgi:hypothetical protein